MSLDRVLYKDKKIRYIEKSYRKRLLDLVVCFFDWRNRNAIYNIHEEKLSSRQRVQR